jgi:lipopolysaccharide transport system ATP-binding protein
MSDVMIRAENIGKRYRIGARKKRSTRLGYVLADMMKEPVRRMRSVIQGQSATVKSETIWALSNISFELKQGEVLGIVGRNGAGKSTLLKIMSRITEPTTGYVDITGRVGSLLEVGTGFHGELTGRENVYMNGAILGMRRHEIARKFDEIVDFAQVEKFIDTPIKHYSSGMSMRLAFAVAAHLEPEILVVDEVLAVGDAEFQRKCLGKMGDVAKQGRTILFVSHNLSAVTTLCTRAILLENGMVSVDGTVREVVEKYMSAANPLGEVLLPDSNKPFALTRIALMNNDRVTTTFTNSEVLTVHIECRATEPILDGQIIFNMMNASDAVIFSSSNFDATGEKAVLETGEHVFECDIPLNIFKAGQYSIRVNTVGQHLKWGTRSPETMVFQIIDDSSPIRKLGQKRVGMIELVLPWNSVAQKQP